jgi:molecular chaperone GrpE
MFSSSSSSSSSSDVVTPTDANAAQTDLPNDGTSPVNPTVLDPTNPAEATVAPALTPAEIEATDTYKTLHQQYLRLAADFENYRKRMVQQEVQMRQYGAENTLKALLPALDNMERAHRSLTETTDPAVLLKSLALVQNDIMNCLNQCGMTRMEVAGQPFDPMQHEAVSQQPSDTVAADHVIADLQAGYMLHERVLRPAMVTVSAGA